MNLEKIMAIAGKSGLYHLTIQTRTGFVAESFADGKKITVGMKNNVSLLTEISIYTYDAEKPLADVLRTIAIKEDCNPCISHKETNDKLIAYFLEILPEYDQDRVYPSDIKKVLNWYNLLQAKGLVSKDAPLTTKTETDAQKESAAEVEVEDTKK
jgi:Domain of unknown function (DUF5606)